VKAKCIEKLIEHSGKYCIDEVEDDEEYGKLKKEKHLDLQDFFQSEGEAEMKKLCGPRERLSNIVF